MILMEYMNYYTQLNIQYTTKANSKEALQLFISILRFQFSAYIDSVSVVYLRLETRTRRGRRSATAAGQQ